MFFRFEVAQDSERSSYLEIPISSLNMRFFTDDDANSGHSQTITVTVPDISYMSKIKKGRFMWIRASGYSRGSGGGGHNAYVDKVNRVRTPTSQHLQVQCSQTSNEFSGGTMQYLTEKDVSSETIDDEYLTIVTEPFFIGIDYPIYYEGTMYQAKDITITANASGARMTLKLKIV